MTRVEAIEVLRTCQPVYERFVKIVKYKPSPQEQECLTKFTQLYESDLIDDDTILDEAAIDITTLGWLVGYVSARK